MSFFKNIFGPKKSTAASQGKLAWLGCDMHNHVLPGIDDGSQSLEDSIVLIRGLKELGIARCVATPHVMHGVHNNSKATISAACELLKQELAHQDIEFEIKYAAEYMLDDQFSPLLSEGKLCPLQSRHILFEMSYLAESATLFEAIFAMQMKGYQPILSHPERYNYFHKNPSVYKKLKDVGCLLQLNVLSASRYYGDGVKAAAASLIKSGMYDFVGTDMHHERHLHATQQLLTRYDLAEMLKNNPIKNNELLGEG